MQQLPPALSAMGAYKNFILYNKATKEPIDPKTFTPFEKGSNWQTDPNRRVLFSELAPYMAHVGDSFGVGFLLTDEDPFFCVDIDYANQGGHWSALANALMTTLAGCAIEVSQSGQGLHIFGTGQPPEHACKNTALGIELYHTQRYIALTGTGAVGDAAANMQHVLPTLVGTYFPPKSHEAKDWTDGPVEGYRSTEEDDELVAKMLGAKGVMGLFDGGDKVAALWENDEDKLAEWYPSDTDTYDRSQADAVLAQHLIFWTGGDCERTQRLMRGSALVRDKWEREDYLRRTIERAYNLQTEFYSVVPEGAEGLPGLRGKSQDQVIYAEKVRAGILASATPEQKEALADQLSPNFWIDNRGRTPAELAAAVKPMEAPTTNTPDEAGKPTRKSGYQYMTIDMQEKFFAGCTYVVDRHKVWRQSNGAFYSPDQFNAEFGGYEFQTDDTGKGKTKKAWAAFLDNQVLVWPRADSTVFEPREAPGAIIQREGFRMLNTYIPIETPRMQGDATPFVQHLEKLIPDGRDRTTLLSYMAACVQHKGHKFQWAPLVQGAPGNGKTLLSRVLKHAIGRRYSHAPRAKNIDAQFNSWMYGKILINVEDVFIPDARRDVMETLKPLITNGDGLEIERKGVDQASVDVCANFFFNANDKGALVKERDDRRICPFHTAQQSKEDLARDGMDGDYFVALYGWLNADGYAIVHDYLATYPIPAEFNPAVEAGGLAERAPLTSSTQEAIEESANEAEHAILEAVSEERLGFRGGFISSVALADMIKTERVRLTNRKFKSTLEDLGYIPHPALSEGKASRIIACDGHKRPRLYVKRGHLAEQLTDPTVITDRYEQAQTLNGGDDEIMKLFEQK